MLFRSVGATAQAVSVGVIGTLASLGGRASSSDEGTPTSCPASNSAEAGGLTTPGRYFGNKSAQEVSEAMTAKYGPAKAFREGAETFYNPKTQRSFNVHTDPAHGPPHVDIRRRGGYPERKYLLGEELP